MRHLRPLVPAVALLVALVAASDTGQEQPLRTSANVTAADTRREAPVVKAVKPAHVQLVTDARLSAAIAYARHRQGRVSFAVRETGAVKGFRVDEGYRSASLVKPMLLIAYLRAHPSLDAAARERLRLMIEDSDNDAASDVYAAVGDQGLKEVAERAGLSHFTTLGYWGDNNLTARDQARLYSELPRLLTKAQQAFLLSLMSRVVAWQRWGIPTVAQGFTVSFKGGWRPVSSKLPEGPWLVHQAAILSRGHERLVLVVLSEGPSLAYGEETLAGVAARLLGAPPSGNRRRTSGAG